MTPYLLTVPIGMCDPDDSCVDLGHSILDCSAPLDEHDLPEGYPAPPSHCCVVIAWADGAAPVSRDVLHCEGPLSEGYLDYLGLDPFAFDDMGQYIPAVLRVSP